MTFFPQTSHQSVLITARRKPLSTENRLKINALRKTTAAVSSRRRNDIIYSQPHRKILINLCCDVARLVGR